MTDNQEPSYSSVDPMDLHPNDVSLDSPRTPKRPTLMTMVRTPSRRSHPSVVKLRLSPTKLPLSPLKSLPPVCKLGWAQESSTEATLHSSTTSFNLDEIEALNLISEIEQAIQQLEQEQAELEERIQSGLRLARARSVAGCEMGSLLSMRKGHQLRFQKLDLVAASYQVQGIRKRIEAEIQRGNYDFDTEELRRQVEDTIRAAKNKNYPTPGDDEMRDELARVSENQKL